MLAFSALFLDVVTCMLLVGSTDATAAARGDDEGGGGDDDECASLKFCVLQLRGRFGFL